MDRNTTPPRWFWIVAGLALLWAMMGCAAYLSQVSMDASELAKLSPAQRELWALLPAWIKSAYALAVWAGFVGAAALLLRRRFARSAYAVSLLAILVQFGWTFTATPILRTIGPSSTLFPVFIAVTGATLLWFANRGTARGWLR